LHVTIGIELAHALELLWSRRLTGHSFFVEKRELAQLGKKLA
jgi:hypothetical protein